MTLTRLRMHATAASPAASTHRASPAVTPERRSPFGCRAAEAGVATEIIPSSPLVHRVATTTGRAPSSATVSSPPKAPAACDGAPPAAAAATPSFGAPASPMTSKTQSARVTPSVKLQNFGGADGSASPVPAMAHARVQAEIAALRSQLQASVRGPWRIPQQWSRRCPWHKAHVLCRALLAPRTCSLLTSAQLDCMLSLSSPMRWRRRTRDEPCAHRLQRRSQNTRQNARRTRRRCRCSVTRPRRRSLS